MAPLGFDGWRWVVLFGAGGALVIWWIRRALPESPRWLATKGRIAEADAILTRLEDKVRRETGRSLPEPEPATAPAAGTEQFSDIWKPPYRRRTVMMLVFHVFQTVAYYGFANWVPSLLIKHGITVTTSAVGSGCICQPSIIRRTIKNSAAVSPALSSARATFAATCGRPAGAGAGWVRTRRVGSASRTAQRKAADLTTGAGAGSELGEMRRHLAAHRFVRQGAEAGGHVVGDVLGPSRPRDGAGDRRVADDPLEEELRPGRGAEFRRPGGHRLALHAPEHRAFGERPVGDDGERRAAVAFVMRCFVELVRIIADMLLPR